MIFVVVFVWLGIAALTAETAPARGRSKWQWLILGLLFSVFALIALFILPPQATPETHLQCPDCAELVRKEARVCKHCGCKLKPQ
jgi:membrane protein implicated in regulation of membrane protease activity